MYAVVLDVLAIEATFIPEVLLELLVDVVGHRLPARAQTHRGVQSPRPVTADSVALPSLTVSFKGYLMR